MATDDRSFGPGRTPPVKEDLERETIITVDDEDEVEQLQETRIAERRSDLYDDEDIESRGSPDAEP